MLFGSLVLPREVSHSLKASMLPAWGEIAPKARVPKGTLYVYFDSKERLFEAIAHEECGVQTEAVFSLDPADHDVESVLTRVGCSFVKFLCCPGAMSPLRTVIAISDRMSEIGREAVKAPIGLARLRPTSRKP